MTLTCALLIAVSVLTGVQARLVTKVYQNFKTRQSKRQTRWEMTEPRAIPAYMLMSEGSYYTAGKIKEKSKGGSYYKLQSACDAMGDGCWGFQTTHGCEDRLGCGQFLILADPGNAKKVNIKGTRVYAKKTYTWDAVPLQCTGLIEDEDAETVGECEENCSQDLECEIYQWYEDETCSRGKSNMCHGNKQVVEGYRARPVFWSFTPTECDGLKYDSTAEGNLEQCQYNCQWDATCDMYEFRKTEKCWRGQSDDCKSLASPLVDNNGKKDEKFKWKNLRKDCSGLTHDAGATTSDECKQNCANSDCSIWQFKVNGQCWSGHASECSPDKDLTVEDGGYRWYINNGDSEENDTDDKELSSNLCPDGYVAIPNNLGGSGKEFAPSDSSWTIEDCKDVCDARKGCTSFEFASGTSQSGRCGTYTDGWDNVKGDDDRLFGGSNWRSCLKDDDKSFNKLCPHGYKAISNNLGGAGKIFAPSDSSRTIEDCKDICDAREGCTSFEFASGSKQSGGCGTYTDGSENVKGDDNRLSKDSNWRSCLKEDVTYNCMYGKSMQRSGEVTRTSLEGCKNRFKPSGQAFVYYPGSRHCQGSDGTGLTNTEGWYACESQQKCTDCSCYDWDGSNYSRCRRTTASDPCNGYCVKCEADGVTPMPGGHTGHTQQCDAYEKRDVYGKLTTTPVPGLISIGRRLLELHQ